jgi:hypothetical protein
MDLPSVAVTRSMNYLRRLDEARLLQAAHFTAQNVQREPLATVQLFCDAARWEGLSVERVERYAKDLRRGAAERSRPRP